MDYIGIDLHKEHTQICVVDAEGEVVLEARIKTNETQFEKFFGRMAPAKILVEATGMSEWAARVLEGLGHEVVIGDTNYGLMYSARNPKVKTDARDARALAEACRLGLHRAAYRASDEEILMRRVITCRRALVEVRTKLATTLRAVARYEGIKIPTGSPEKIAQRMRKAGIKEEFFEQVESLLNAIDAVTEQIDKADKRILELVKTNEKARLLQTLPGIGPVTAAAFCAVIGEPDRFQKGRQVQSYLGLVPREYSSGERTRRGRITKAGNPYLRALLVQAALRILRYRPESARELWSWASNLAERRGKNVARMALARRLSSVMFAMIRDEVPFQPALQAA